jgi:hypothetical protein
MDIRVLKLITGEEVLGEIVSDSAVIRVKNPVGIAVVRDKSGMPNVGFAPFPLHAESKSGLTVDFERQNVVYSYVPAEDFIRNYDQIFGSGIILPKQQSIVTG